MDDLFQPIGGLLVYSEEDQSQTIANCIEGYIRDLYKLGVYVIGSISPPFPLFKEVFQRFHPDKNFDEVPGPILYSVLPFRNIVHIYDVQHLILKLQLLLRQGDIRFETMFGRQKEYLVKWSDLSFVMNAHPQFKILATFFASNLQIPKRVHVFNDDIYKMYVHLENNGFLSGYSAGGRVFVHSMSALMQYFDYDYVHVRKTVYNWDDLIFALSKMKFQKIDVPYMQNPNIPKTKKRKKKRSRRPNMYKLENSVTKETDSKNNQHISETLSHTNDSFVNGKESVTKSSIGQKAAKEISVMNLQSKELQNGQLNNIKGNVINSENIITSSTTMIETANKTSQLNLQVNDGRIEDLSTSKDSSANSEEENFVSSLVSEIFLTITEGQIEMLSTSPNINSETQEQTIDRKLEKESESPKIYPENLAKTVETQIAKQSKDSKIPTGISKQSKGGELETKPRGSKTSAEMLEMVTEEQLEKRQKFPKTLSGLPPQMTEKHLEKQPKISKTSLENQEKSTEGQLGKRTKNAKMDPVIPEQQSERQLKKQPEFLQPPPGFTAKRKERKLQKQSKNSKTPIEYIREGQLEKLSDVPETPSRFMSNKSEERIEKRPKGPKTPPGSPPSSPDSDNILPKPPPRFTANRTGGQLEKQPKSPRSTPGSPPSFADSVDLLPKPPPRYTANRTEGQLEKQPKGPKTPPGSPDSDDLGGNIERTRELILHRIPGLREWAISVPSTTDSLPSTSAQAQISGLKRTAKKLSTAAIQETKNTSEVSDLKNTISIRQITEKLKLNQVSISEESGQTQQEISITSTTAGPTYKTFNQNDGPIPDYGFENNVVTSELICSMRGIMVLTESAKRRKIQSMRSDAIVVEPIDLFMAKIQKEFNGIKNVFYDGSSFRLLDPDQSFSCLESDSGLYLIKRS
ncbi:uncharacterized protein LOC114331384 isoform X2 [Diabrotica virgifera virgifera]|nr:uncharacterized protein LOC114331384 isoform X2 [Diabrotica virgifera virgifera]